MTSSNYRGHRKLLSNSAKFLVSNTGLAEQCAAEAEASSARSHVPINQAASSSKLAGFVVAPAEGNVAIVIGKRVFFTEV